MVKNIAEQLYGVIPPVLTPLCRNERVDTAGLRRLLKFLKKGGVHGVFMLGSTSEVFALGSGERIRAVETAACTVGDSIPVIAGVSAESTLKAVRNAMDLYKAGAAAGVSTIPYYIRLREAETIEHFKILADRSPMPIMIYSHPLTGFFIDADLYKKLSCIPNIIGAKDSFADAWAFQKTAAFFRKKTKFRLFQGSEFMMASSILCGASGCVPAIANIIPGLCSDLFNAASGGDGNKAFSMQNRVCDTCNALFGRRFPSSFFSGLKYALKCMGICADTVSKPFIPLTGAEKGEIRKSLKSLSIC